MWRIYSNRRALINKIKINNNKTKISNQIKRKTLKQSELPLQDNFMENHSINKSNFIPH